MVNEKIKWDELQSRILRGAERKILLVTGKNSFHSTGAEAVSEEILKGCTVKRFYDFDINPKIEDVVRGVDIIRQFNPEFIIAVGGGSVMDMAKLIHVFSAQNTDNFQELVQGSVEIAQPKRALICIPTTFGTGSESTHFAVIYIDKVKYSFASPYCMPEAYILDTSLTRSATRYQLACSAFDALCQSIESYWAKNATNESQEYALEAMKLLWPNIEDACVRKTDASFQALSVGANLAGKAINISKTTAPHALSYYLTSHYDIPHGHAVALCFPAFFALNVENAADEKLKNTMTTINQVLNAKSATEASEKFIKLMHRVGLETDLSHWGIDQPQQFEAIASSVNLERLLNHPIALSKDDIIRAFI